MTYNFIPYAPSAGTEVIQLSSLDVTRVTHKPLLSSCIWMFLSIFTILLGACRISYSQTPQPSPRDYTYNPNHYDAKKIIQAMEHPHPDLVIISAHRGLHSVPGDNPSVPGLPENSLAAVAGAATAGLELLELDIKQTPDGQLTFSHDKTWGRQTVPADGSTPFDPFKDPAQQASVNLPLATTSMATLQANWRLRDSVTLLRPANPEPPPTLQQVIAFYNQHQIGAVIAFDVKDTDTFKKAWAVVTLATDFQNRPFSEDVIWKVSGSNYKTPGDLKVDFPSDYDKINYWPVYNTSDISPPAASTQTQAALPPDSAAIQKAGPTTFGSEQAIIDSLDSFYADPSIRIISAEITQKEVNGILNNTRIHSIANGRSAAEFSATGDYFSPDDPNTARFFNSADGSCCQTLDQFYYNGTPYGQPSDTADSRGDFNFVQSQSFNIITADTALSWRDKLSALQRRNISYMQEDGYNASPSCQVGPNQYPDCDANGQTTYTVCAQGEQQKCTFDGDRNVAYGANGRFITKTAVNEIDCNLNSFGGQDPAPGVIKTCYVSPAVSNFASDSHDNNPIYCADEGQTCDWLEPQPALGILAGNGHYSLGSPGSPTETAGFHCDTTTFGADPAIGFKKSCFYQLDQQYVFYHPGPSGYSFCAGEGGRCAFRGPGRIAYGASGSFTYKVLPYDTTCSNESFGVDPKPGYTKDCWYQYQVPYTSNSSPAPGNPGQAGPGTGTGGQAGPGYPSDASGNFSQKYTTANSKTYTVSASGQTFTVSQPNDSVASYIWSDGGSPSEVITSANGTQLGYAFQQVAVANSSGAAPSATITVDASKRYQVIDGFGGAMTDSAASLIAGSPYRNMIMNTLFGTNGGAGLNMVRSPMGSSDLMADPNDIHTYEDTPGNFTATTQASDTRQIDVLTQAKGIVGTNFKLLGTPWSAPGWLKRGGSLLPAQCGTDQNELSIDSVQQYAGYFANYVATYAAKGLSPWAVSMQNEPENCKKAMPTTLLSATDEIALAQSLKQQLPSSVKVLGWDHNWNDPDFVNAIVGSGSVDAIGYHCYDGNHYGNQTQAVPTYMTECSGFTASSGNVPANLGFEVANLLIGPLRYGSRGSLYWTMAQDPNGNPHLGGSDACQDCRGLITVNSDGSYQPSQDLYYWAQFARFIPPGSIRIDSNNSGDLSTVAFRNGTQTTLVVLNSATAHADGGSAGSDERNLRGHILQWDGDTSQQKVAWLVGVDGYRRYINDGSTFNCLKYDAGMQGPDVESAGALDKYINILDVWAVCGASVMGTRSELEVGTYLKSTGGARLTLTSNGLTSSDSTGAARWAPPGVGDRLILQQDQNLALYSGLTQVWSSNTAGTGAVFLAIRDDGTFALFDKQNKQVWASPVDTASYRGKMIQWDGDTAAQKTSWMVGYDGVRRVVHDLSTFQCLHDAGAGNSLTVSSNVLNSFPDLTDVWAACGTDRVGPNGGLEVGSHLSAGSYSLTLTPSDLVLTLNGQQVWDTGHGGAELVLQTNGNLVLYDNSLNPTWDTQTSHATPGWFVLGSDGSLRLYDGSGNQIWSRSTADIPTGPSGYVSCGNEGSTCSFSGTARVAFGVGGTFNYGNYTNGVACSASVFGDPKPGVAKACFYSTQ